MRGWPMEDGGLLGRVKVFFFGTWGKPKYTCRWTRTGEPTIKAGARRLYPLRLDLGVHVLDAVKVGFGSSNQQLGV